LNRTFKNFLPRVILQWEPDPTTNIYATYAKGNKPGDFNTAVIGLTPAQKAQVSEQTGAGDVVGEEELDNFEVGLKKSVFNNAVYFTAAGYYMKWKNQQNRTQATITDLTIPAGVRVVPVIVSAGETDLWGVELEANARLTRKWTLSGTFGWAASKYQVFLCGFCQRLLGTADVAGRSSPRFPEFSGTTSLAYNDVLSNGLNIFGRIDGIFTGRAWDEAFNLARTADAVRVNARIGIERDWWRAEVFVRNLLNDKNYLAAARFTDFTKGNFNLNDFVTNVTPAEPRQLGVRVRFDL
jgi:iron complex outermembrane receptor protein